MSEIFTITSTSKLLIIYHMENLNTNIKNVFNVMFWVFYYQMLGSPKRLNNAEFILLH